MMKKARKMFAILFTLVMMISMIGVAPVSETSAATEETSGAYTASFGAQFDVNVNADFGEWPDLTGFDKTFNLGEEVTMTCDFGQTVAIGANYAAINTNIPYSESLTAELKSLKVDGVEVACAPENLYLNNEGTDGGLRLTLINLWNSDIPAPVIDPAAMGSFNTLEITFVVNEAAAEEPETAGAYTASFGAQFDVNVNADFGEWPDLTGFDKTFNLGEEVTMTCDFGQTVAIGANYAAINTNIPYSESLTAELKSLKVDGVEVACAPENLYLNNEGTDGGLRLTLINLWNSDIPAPVIDPAAMGSFNTLEITFVVNEAAAEEPDTAGAYTASFGAQFDVNVNADFGEWPDLTGFDKTFNLGEEVTMTCDFGQTVAIGANYAAINTNIPYSESLTAELKSLKVDGVEVACAPENLYLNNEGTDGGLRLTLINLWNSDIPAPVIDPAAMGSFNTLEITFVVNEAAAEEPDTAGAYTASFGAQFDINVNADFGEWPDLTGFDKTFNLGEEVTMTCDFGQTVAIGANYAAINTNIPYSESLTAELKSVKVDGVEVACAPENLYLNNEGTDGGLRLTLINLWNSDIPAPAIDPAAMGNFNTLEITFVVNQGEEVAPEPTPETTPEPTPEPTPALSVDLNGTYHAYLGFQTPKFSFRNAFDDATYGRDTEHFNVVCGWDSSNALITKPGTFTDVEIAGNGTYTVAVEGLDLNGDFDSQEYFNLIFLSTDIPNSGEITISDMKLSVNGSSVDINPILSPDSPNWVNMLIQNIWNADVKEIGYYAVPPTKMSITFTVSGFAYDKAVEEAPADPTAAPTTAPSTGSDSTPAGSDSADKDESGSNTGLIIGIVIAVVAVAAVVVVVVVSKKKKK